MFVSVEKERKKKYYEENKDKILERQRENRRKKRLKNKPKVKARQINRWVENVLKYVAKAENHESEE